MPDTKEPRWSFSAAQIIVGILAVISMTLGTWKAISEKADKTEVQSLADKVPSLADKRDVESLRNELNELSAKRREDFVMLKNILTMAEKTDARMVSIENNQTWQIQQEVKRLQWQSFKGEPPATPPANTNR